MAKNPEQMEETMRIMGALVRQPPKPHEDMKLGQPRGKPSKSDAKARPAKKSGRNA
jgi:hypothetical protein